MSRACVLAVCLLAALASCEARSLSAHARSLLAATMPASQVVANIKSIATQSSNLQSVVKQVVPPTVGTNGAINVPTNYFTLAQEIQQGLQEIANLGNNAVSEMQTTPLPASFSTADQTTIFNTFKTFVQVHQQLLSILISKRGILSNIPFAGQGIAAALRAIESVVDAIAYGLIDACQAEAGNLTNQFNSLDVTLSSATNDYADPIPDPTALLTGTATVG